jgi:hypothetical protein
MGDVGVCKIIGLFVYGNGIGLVEPSGVKMSNYYFVDLTFYFYFYVYIPLFQFFDTPIDALVWVGDTPIRYTK